MSLAAAGSRLLLLSSLLGGGGGGVNVASALAAPDIDDPAASGGGTGNDDWLSSHQDLVDTYGADFRCPHASEWIAKGPERAWEDIMKREEQQGRRRAQEDNNATDGGGGGGGGFGGEAWGSFTGGGGSPPKCALAPGPIGAAHQAAYSAGYQFDCPDAPAESSPYQWPLRWSASLKRQSIPFGSDEVKYESRGKVFYRLDKNWKRADKYYQDGILQTVGQVPCDGPGASPVEDTPLACNRTFVSRTTVLHRGSRMVFLRWAEDADMVDDDVANIVNCTWLDLKVVGNIRPDWYMDDRGDSTATQYLGDQHVYHLKDFQEANGVDTGTSGGKLSGPRLVKQWRKTDFANQYFTMSMLGNPGPDGIHWPMILNVPGEGFGDDFLQSYDDHALLSEDDTAPFLLDEAFEAAGGICPQRVRPRGDDIGPPVGQFEHVPSNLEIDDKAWCDRVHTFSPVWVPPATADEQETSTVGEYMATTEVEKDVTVESCYDVSSDSARLAFAFDGLDESEDGRLPWVAVSFRADKECLMTPRGGGDGEIIFLTDQGEVDGGTTALHGPLPASAKSFKGLDSIVDGLSPLDESEGFSMVNTAVEEGVAANGMSSLVLDFHREVTTGSAPEVMYLSYAIGSTPELGYHATRKCFEITSFPPCPATEEEVEAETKALDEANRMSSSATSATAQVQSPSLGLATVTACLFLALSSVVPVFSW